MMSDPDDELSPALGESQCADILEREVERYLRFGFQITSQTMTRAQLSQPRRFAGGGVALSFLLMGGGMLWLPLFGLGLLGLLICLVGFALSRDKIVYLRVADDGTIHIRGDALPDPVDASGRPSPTARSRRR